MRFLLQQGVSKIVAPMVDSDFAMQKYQEIKPDAVFDLVGVTFETIGAVGRIEAILDAGRKLAEVTVGRPDLTASYAGHAVDGLGTVAMSCGLETLPLDDHRRASQTRNGLVAGWRRCAAIADWSHGNLQVRGTGWGISRSGRA